MGRAAGSVTQPPTPQAGPDPARPIVSTRRTALAYARLQVSADDERGALAEQPLPAGPGEPAPRRVQLAAAFARAGNDTTPRLYVGGKVRASEAGLVDRFEPYALADGKMVEGSMVMLTSRRGWYHAEVKLLAVGQRTAGKAESALVEVLVR